MMQDYTLRRCSFVALRETTDVFWTLPFPSLPLPL